MRASVCPGRREASERPLPAPRTRSLGVFCRWLCIIALGWCSLATQGEERVAVTQADLHVSRGPDPGTFVDAQFDVPMPGSLRDAIDHGVALYFVIELEVSRRRWYWFDQRLVNDAIEYRISFSPLTRQYRLTRGGLAQPYDSLDQALATLRRVSQWRVGEAGLLENGRVEGRIRLRLDTSMLPKPFQVSALTDRDWTLASDWAPLAIVGDRAAEDRAADSRPGDSRPADSHAADN